jgi:hypothetical protein
MYSIKENLSKEENIQLAKEYGDKAKEILKKFDDLLLEANKFVPGRTFGLSKSKLEKHKSPSEVLERLYSASRSEYNTKSTYEMRERMAKEKLQKEEEQKRQVEREQAQKDILNQAIAYCLENGRTFSDGLTVDNAIAIANDIAFNKEVAKREEEIGDNYIGFSGQNCEDECDGWNPKDRRCQCGNRRVSWSDYYSDFRDMSIYAEAY